MHSGIKSFIETVEKKNLKRPSSIQTNYIAIAKFESDAHKKAGLWNEKAKATFSELYGKDPLGCFVVLDMGDLRSKSGSKFKVDTRLFNVSGKAAELEEKVSYKLKLGIRAGGIAVKLKTSVVKGQFERLSTNNVLLSAENNSVRPCLEDPVDEKSKKRTQGQVTFAIQSHVLN